MQYHPTFSSQKKINQSKKPVVFFHSLGQEVWPKQDTLLGMVGSLKCWKLSDGWYSGDGKLGLKQGNTLPETNNIALEN